MRFFAQQLYDGLQSPQPAAAQRAKRKWDQATRAFHRHRRRLQSRLTPRMHRFANLYFHDCIVESICFKPREVRIVLVGYKHSFMSSRAVQGRHELRFDGVDGTDATFDLIGSYWGYEELSRVRDSHEIRVLNPHDRREFLIRFKSAHVVTTTERRRSEER